MIHVHKKMDVSERRACRVLEQPRSSQRYLSTKVGKDAALVERMVALSKENPRYGYRRVWALLRREGWEVNKKRVQRLWREAGLRVPAKERKTQAFGDLRERMHEETCQIHRPCLVLRLRDGHYARRSEVEGDACRR